MISFSFARWAENQRTLISKTLSIILLLSLFVAGQPVRPVHAATIYRVAADGIIDTCGSDFVYACDLQYALSLAIAGDELWVKAGLYKPDGASPGDQTLSFNIPPGVKVYGGFDGGETQVTDRDWVANITVLSGDIDGNDTVGPKGIVADAADILGNNSYHVVTMDGAAIIISARGVLDSTSAPITSTTVLDGFTITAGSADPAAVLPSGGGLVCDGHGTGGVCSPSLTNLTFSGNRAGDTGGAMLLLGNNQGTSSPALTSVLFQGNRAEGNGGALLSEGTGGTSSPQLIDVTFNYNSSGAHGGAMYSTGGGISASNPGLTNVTFYFNTSLGQGGGMFTMAAGPVLTFVTFMQNHAGGAGGGMYNDSSTPALTDVTFDSNSADTDGGGMYNADSSSTLTFGGFSANSAGGYGGGMADGGIGHPTLTDVGFSTNQAGNGGAMMINGSTLTLTGGLFDLNYASVDGGAIWTNVSSGSSLANVTFSGNYTGYHGGAIASYSGGLNLLDATFSGNHAPRGGAMYDRMSDAVLSNVTFDGNWADYGGAMYEDIGDPTLTNVTLAGNSAAYGGGMYAIAASNPALTNVTFSGNWASTIGGAIYIRSSSATIEDGIFWNNPSEIYNPGSPLVVNDSIIFGGCPNNAVCNNVLSSNPKLLPLASNGGLTQTMALGAGSPAIDAGAHFSSCAATDQRGVIRPQGPRCDIGAFEVVVLSISGNAGAAGVHVSYDEGGPKSVTSDINGNYSFPVPYGWSGIATPGKGGDLLTPEFREYTDVTTNQTGQDYAIVLRAPTVEGAYPSAASTACLKPRVGVRLLLTSLVRNASGSFDPSTVSLKLDGMDKMSVATIAQNATYPVSQAFIQYTPTSNLTLGSHQVQFLYPSASGTQTLTWNFTASNVACSASAPLEAPATTSTVSTGFSALGASAPEGMTALGGAIQNPYRRLLLPR